METLEGSVEDIVFRNEDTGFTVLEVGTDLQLITAVGVLSSVAVGEQLILHGFFTSHPTYGSQFKISACERSMPSTASAILKYLSSRAIKGVGPATAKRIVQRFGDKSLEVMEKDPLQLATIPGISANKAKAIGEEFQRIFGIRSVMMLLAQYNIDAATSIKVWKRWGANAPDLLRENPYVLCCEEIGMEFPEVEPIAAQLDISPQDPNRLQAGLTYVLRHNLNNGHSCIPRTILLSLTAKLLEVDPLLLEEELEGMVQREELFQKQLDGTDFLYLPALFLAEDYCASRLGMMLALPQETANEALEHAVDQLEAEIGIAYANLQRKAILQAMTHNLFILTGGPGTGKTTTVNAILTLLERQGSKVALAAPTGRAAKRMSEVTGREAKTIHRLLEVDFTAVTTSLSQFKRNERNPLPYDAVVVDEMSMVDILLMESLLRAVKPHAKLILVGDADQLPSVGAGNVLGDLIASEEICTVQLTEVFRQASQSLIVTNAHQIVRGELPELTRRDGDFFFMARHSYEATAQTVVELCTARLPRTYGLSPLWDIQVICPSRINALGTVELNSRLQQALNPPDRDKREFTRYNRTFREGDKVMQIKNNYDVPWTNRAGEKGMGVYNGDIGVIEMIDKPTRTLMVRYEDRLVDYPFDLSDQLELAYAVTVHKSQGSEFEAVIIPLMRPSSRLYYRNLLYTAVTRAKRLLILVGEGSAIPYMVQNNRKTLRYTGLRQMLQEQLQSAFQPVSVPLTLEDVHG